MAVPLLGRPQEIEGVRIYPDSVNPSIFYYAPGKLLIPVDANGAPEISFLQMRYMGTSVSGDKGEFRTQSILSFRVKMASIEAKRIALVKAKLRTQGASVPNLRPLPIRKVETLLNYTRLVDQPREELASDSKPSVIGAGSLENVEGTAPREGYWSERFFTIAPDDLTSQALGDALQAGRVILSLSYAFYAEGIASEQETAQVEGNVDINHDEESREAEKPKPNPYVVLADTVSVTIDAVKYPNIFKQIDINESVPANYAALSVYCYDFNNSLRPDLFEKIVEIQAKSITGKPLTATVTFSKSTPDIYSATVRFKFAVSLKEPYAYRIREITMSGEEKIKPWQPGKPWSQMLDVTTPSEELPKPSESSSLGDEQ
ncbi:MAG: hypothetical protein QHH26_00555 [Armatimonadota bacterium]|nr:hypothetical protein [Armatimonadota bacterium]